MVTSNSVPPELPEDWAANAEEPPTFDDQEDPEVLYGRMAALEAMGGFEALSTEPPATGDLYQTRLFDAAEIAADFPF